MKIFITGATGYIGNILAHELANSGHTIHALLRDKNKSSRLQHKNIRLFFGDIINTEQLKSAIAGCEQAYHVAGQVRPWMKDATTFYQSNVDGTSNVCEQARQEGVRKLVFTSSAGVWGPSLNEPLNEESARIKKGFFSHYDRSKKMAEDILLDYAQNGLNAVVVNPAKVFGPGYTSHALTTNSIIHSFLKKKIVFIPSPGTFQICFSYVDNVVNGHILAMKKGIAGQRYILGGHNISYYDFFDRIRKLSGIKGKIISIPRWGIKFVGYMQEFKYKIMDGSIMFTAGQVNQVFEHHAFSSEKAVSQLGYHITGLEESLLQTIKYLKYLQ